MNVSVTKVYVNVILRNTKEGELLPLKVEWKDGLAYEIDKILRITRAASTKVGGNGIRYTIVVNGRETFLFHENDKWFVEAKQYS